MRRFVSPVAVAVAVAATVTFMARPIGAQNLVVNPGFEQHGIANDLGWLFGEDMFKSFSVNGWSQTTNGSSDYFFRQKHGANMNISPYAGMQDPATGNAYAGFISWVPGREYREYITGELSQPLEKGKKYAFRMKIATGTKCPYLVNELGVYFSASRFEDKKTQATVHQTPQVWLDVSPMHYSPETWIVVQNVFVATGNEKYFTLGNFRNDTTTKVMKRSVTEEPCAYNYFYADDIVVELTTEDQILPGKKTAISDQIAAGKTFIARGINFDLDKATLRPESYLQLHEIAAELKRKPTLKVDIRGYTDSSGSEPHNLELSKARAKAAADYLVSTGIDKSRITFGGYGSANPLPDVDPALNRRVEFHFF